MGDDFYNYLLQKIENNRKLFDLINNSFTDFKLHSQYSALFKLDSLEKEEALLIHDYHSIEKGMLYLNMKPRFAQNRVKRIHELL